MSPKRIKQRFEDFTQALIRLEAVLKEDPNQSDAFIDATIQRFEFAYELAWKLMQDYLRFNGIEANNPRAVFKESFQQKIISDGESWLTMLEDRNKTTHIYDEKQARRIYEAIKQGYPRI
ncbi:MAG: nucleotidyltransferase substrate binding protein [Candidatus Omnitrophica bacterium]|nr:nucleotidyltransferase substrate binding protein [Candidatus Omnitrophota bacterium]